MSASLVSALVGRCGAMMVVIVAFVKGWLMVKMFILVIIVVLLWLSLMMSVMTVNCLIVASLMRSFLVMLLSPRVRVLDFLVFSVVLSL